MDPQTFTQDWANAKQELQNQYGKTRTVSDIEIQTFLSMKSRSLIIEKIENTKHELINEQMNEFKVLRGQLKQNFDTLNENLKSKK